MWHPGVCQGSHVLRQRKLSERGRWCQWRWSPIALTIMLLRFYRCDIPGVCTHAHVRRWAQPWSGPPGNSLGPPALSGVFVAGSACTGSGSSRQLLTATSHRGLRVTVTQQGLTPRSETSDASIATATEGRALSLACAACNIVHTIIMHFDVLLSS